MSPYHARAIDPLTTIMNPRPMLHKIPPLHNLLAELQITQVFAAINLWHHKRRSEEELWTGAGVRKERKGTQKRGNIGSVGGLLGKGVYD